MASKRRWRKVGWHEKEPTATPATSLSFSQCHVHREKHQERKDHPEVLFTISCLSLTQPNNTLPVQGPNTNKMPAEITTPQSGIDYIITVDSDWSVKRQPTLKGLHNVNNSTKITRGPESGAQILAAEDSRKKKKKRVIIMGCSVS